MNLKKSKNVFHLLQQRENSLGVQPLRLNWKIMSTLVCSSTREFRKRFEDHSTSTMRYENDKLFTNGCRMALSITNLSNLYQFDFLGAAEKIVDGRLCEMSNLSYPNVNYFIGLTNKNRLFFADSVNGSLVQMIDLPRSTKFSIVAWSSECEVIFVKGKQQPPDNHVSVHKGRHPSNFVFSFFNVFPLKYLCTIRLDYQLSAGISNVYIAQECLMLVDWNNNIQVYSLPQIFASGVSTNVSESSDYSCFPSSVSVDTEIKYLPPCLYKVKAANDSIEMGSYPWRCLYRPPGKPSYIIEDLIDKSLVKVANGMLNFDTDRSRSMETNVFFHPDESGNVLIVHDTSITCYEIVESKNNKGFVLSAYWTSNLPTNVASNDEDSIMYTSSGRRITTKNIPMAPMQTIESVSYLNDLDILCLTVCYEIPLPDSFVEGEFSVSEDDKTEWICKGKLLLLNNSNGKLIREILLEEHWNDVSEDHEIELDLNFIVRIVKKGAANFSCYVYRLEECEHSLCPAETDSPKKETCRRRRSSRLAKS